jgi:hypothetical protein
MVMAPGTNGLQFIAPGVTEWDEEGPTVAAIMALKRDGEAYYRAFWSQCATAERYYFQENAVPSPAGFDPVRPATARGLINTATDHVDVTNIVIEVPDPSPRAKARAERIQKALVGMWAAVKGPVLRTATFHAFTYGVAFLKPFFESDAWPNQPPPEAEFPSEDEYKRVLGEWLEKRRIAHPLALYNINPRNLIWDDSRSGMKWAIEWYGRTDAQVIKHRYGDWATKKDNGTLLEWMEYWDAEWCVYVADGVEVWRARHGYGFLPYFMVHPAHSIQWDAGRPERRYRGLLTPVLPLLDSEARLMTAYEAAVRQWAWPGLDFSGPIAQATEAREKYELMGMNLLPPGVTVTASPRISAPPELLQQLNLVQNLIEEATFPNVVRGVRPKGVSSGFGVSVLAGMGRLVFQGTADGLARAIEHINAAWLQLIENKLKGPLTVHARTEAHSFDQTIGPDDIKGYHESRVRLKAEAPEEREREALLGANLYRAGIISRHEAQRRAGITSPLEEALQQVSEGLMQAPEVQMALMRLVSERLGLLGQLTEAAGGPPSAGGSPPAFNPGQFQPGLAQGPRLGEAGIQGRRVATRDQQSVFPKGLDAITRLGRVLGGAGGGAQRIPSGQTVGE